MRPFIVAGLATSLALAPAAAPAQAVAPAYDVRAGAELTDANEIAGSPIVLVGIGVVALVALIIIVSDDDEDEPDSP